MVTAGATGGGRLPGDDTTLSSEAHSPEGTAANAFAAAGVVPDAVVIEFDHVTKRFGDFIAHHVLPPIAAASSSRCRTVRVRQDDDPADDRWVRADDGGAVRLEGTDVSRTPPYKRNVNTVFQHYVVPAHVGVENVAFGPRSRKLSKTETAKRVDEMLAVVRLDDFARRKPAQLSGGQQQRGGPRPRPRELSKRPAARRAAGCPRPQAATGHAVRAGEIQREVGITSVYVTHDQEEALTMSDRIAVMNGGCRADRHPGGHLRLAGERVRRRFIGQANLWPCRVVGAAAPTADGSPAFDVEVLGTTMASPAATSASRSGERPR